MIFVQRVIYRATLVIADVRHDLHYETGAMKKKIPTLFCHILSQRIIFSAQYLQFRKLTNY